MHNRNMCSRTCSLGLAIQWQCGGSGPACRPADQEGTLELPSNQNVLQLLMQALRVSVRSFQVFRSADTKRWRRVPDRFGNGKIDNINSLSQYGKCRFLPGNTLLLDLWLRFSKVLAGASPPLKFSASWPGNLLKQLCRTQAMLSLLFFLALFSSRGQFELIS